MTSRKNIRNKIIRSIAIVVAMVMMISIQSVTVKAEVSSSYVLTGADIDIHLLNGIKEYNNFSTLTAGMAQNMEEIIVEINEVESLRGVEDFFPNLKHLNVFTNKLENLEGILKLKKLEELIIGGNQISRVSDLVVFKDTLKRLSLSFSYLSYTDGLGELINLEYLSLFSAKLDEMPNLTKLTKLDKELNKSSFRRNGFTWGDLMRNLPRQITSDFELMHIIAEDQPAADLYVNRISDVAAVYHKENIYNGTWVDAKITKVSSKRIVCDLGINPVDQGLTDIEFEIWLPLGFSEAEVYNSDGQLVNSRKDTQNIYFVGNLGTYTLVAPGVDEPYPSVTPTPDVSTNPTPTVKPTIKPTPKPTTVPTVKLSSVKPGKLTTKTKKITGTTTAKATVNLMSGKKTIKKIVAKANGKFTISGLKLKKYKKKTLKLVVSKSKYKSKSKTFAKIKK